MNEIIEVVNSKEQIRSIGNSVYICIPRYLVRSKKITPGDPVSISVLSDGTIKIIFDKEVKK